MFNFRLYEHADLYGLFYDFPERGDGIPMHTHEDDQKHNIIVLRGSVEVYGPYKEWTRTLHAGDVLDMTDDMHPHEIAALEPHTATLGLFIHGKPANLPPLEDDERAGALYKPITISLL